jgi:predicted transcriptional regulator
MAPRHQLARQIGADESRSPSEETIHALLNRLYTKQPGAIFQAKSCKKGIDIRSDL